MCERERERAPLKVRMLGESDARLLLLMLLLPLLGLWLVGGAVCCCGVLSSVWRARLPPVESAFRRIVGR